MGKLISLLLLTHIPLSAVTLGEYLDGTQEVKQLFHGKHSYIYFKGKGIVHNPDCPCSIQMKGVIDYYNDGAEITLWHDWENNQKIVK